MSNADAPADLAFDPVADGKPHRLWYLWGLALVLLAVAGLQVYYGSVLDAVMSATVAAWTLLYDLQRRTAWMDGYLSAIRSVQETVDELEARQR